MAVAPPVRVPTTRSAPKALGWIEFCAQFFPVTRECHDFEALIAYGDYRRDGGIPGGA
jgi:hypothetical protein